MAKTARRGLPADYRPAIDQSLDHLTDPTSTPTSRTQSEQEPSGSNSGNSGNSVTPSTRKEPAAPGKKNQPAPKAPVPRRHVKVREDLYERLRAGVWHARVSGRPRLRLDDLVDEIVAEWYEREKERNGGKELEDYGPLR